MPAASHAWMFFSLQKPLSAIRLLTAPSTPAYDLSVASIGSNSS